MSWTWALAIAIVLVDVWAIGCCIIEDAERRRKRLKNLERRLAHLEYLADRSKF